MLKKILIILYFLNFNYLASADQIKNFEIEGMTVGDSLLNYMSKSEIIDQINSENSYHYPNNSFVTVTYRSGSFEVYDDVGVIIDPNDKDYIIFSLEGTIHHKNTNCRDQQIKITNDLKEFFDPNKYKFIQSLDLDYIDDDTGESKVHYEDFYFNDESAVRVICWVLSKDFKSQGYIDTLAVAVNSSKFMNFVNENK